MCRYAQLQLMTRPMFPKMKTYKLLRVINVSEPRSQSASRGVVLLKD